MKIIKNFIFGKESRLGSAQGKRYYDLPLDRSAGTGFLVLLIAMMTFLAVMALAGALSMNALSARWSSGLENKMTIEIPAEKDGGVRTAREIDLLAQRITQRLEKIPGIKNFNVLREEEIRDLIAPWLGDDAVLGDMPLPGLISVELNDSSPEIPEQIRRELAAIDRTIRLDTHEAWLGDLLRLTGALQFAAALITLIIGATTIMAVAGSIRTRMALHAEDVELLHLMGASDAYITRQFQRHALIIAFKGSVIGMAASVILLGILALISGSADEAVLPDMSLNAPHIIMLFVMPVLACLIAALAARFTVLRVLSMMP